MARDIGCSVNTTHLWLLLHRWQDGQATMQQEQAIFVPVNIIDGKQYPIEIVMPSGVTIKLADGSLRYIVDLLRILTSC